MLMINKDYVFNLVNLKSKKILIKFINYFNNIIIHLLSIKLVLALFKINSECVNFQYNTKI